MVGITRGGLVPAVIVAREAGHPGCRYDLGEILSLQRRSGRSALGSKVIKSPQADLMGDGTGILIVDDLVDSGKTLELVRKLYPTRISPPSTPNPRASRRLTAISPRSARTPGFSSPGIWRCNTSSPSAVRTDAQP